MSFTSITNNNTRLFNNNIMGMERQDQETNDDNNNTTTNTQACSCTTENGSESPLSNSTMFNDLSRNQHHNLISNATNSSASTISSSPKKSNGRRSVQKRVVSIPIKEVEASRLKGEGCHASTPPSDSWAWRKYGQKPIKGSPYPRGYYRCSSSKGCPARKQVERSRVDPTMILVTYSAEHNHPWPLTSSRNNQNNHNKHQSSASTSAALVSKKPDMVKEELSDEAVEEICSPQPAAAAEPDVGAEAAEERYVGLMVGGGGGDDDVFAGWFGGHVDVTLQSPIFTEERGSACESLAAAVFPMREEDESLFADLGELPECSLVFRHRGVGPQVEIC